MNSFQTSKFSWLPRCRMKPLAALRRMLAVAICLCSASCRDSSSPARISVTAPGVHLTFFKIDAGKATEGQLKQGLQAAADVLSAAYLEASKTHPQLMGRLQGTFHIESNGTVRIFAKRISEFTPGGGDRIDAKFIGATLGGQWRFPSIGNDLMLTVEFKFEPSNVKDTKRTGD